MPLSSVMGAPQTNINAHNIQLYGGRKVFADTGALRGDIQGMMAANREYNTYLSGLARLTGAGADMIDKFWGIMLQTQERDTETALSKAYRDMFTDLSVDEKYQGAGAMGLSNAFMERKQQVYDQFLKDNPDVNKRILNNINAHLQNRYYDRTGALQTERLTQWHTQSKINNMAEIVDTSCLSQLGDMNALADIYNKSKELFGNDPVRGRSLANEGLRSVLSAWAGQNPSGFMNWANGNKDKVLKMFGGSNAKDIDTIFNHAKSQVRADQSFAWAAESHNRQRMLFERAEKSRETAIGMFKEAFTAVEQGKPVDITAGTLLKKADDMSPADMAALISHYKQIGIPLDFNPDKTDRRNGFIAMVMDPDVDPRALKKLGQQLLEEREIEPQDLYQAVDRHGRVLDATEKMGYNAQVAEYKKRAIAGDWSALQDMTTVMNSQFYNDSDYKFVLQTLQQANSARDILGQDMLSAQLHVAETQLAPKGDITTGGLAVPADAITYSQFVPAYYHLADEIKKDAKMSWIEKRQALDITNRNSQAYALFNQFLQAQSGVRDDYTSFTPTQTGTNSMVPSGTSPRLIKYNMPKIKHAQGSPTEMTGAGPSKMDIARQIAGH